MYISLRKRITTDIVDDSPDGRLMPDTKIGIAVGTSKFLLRSLASGEVTQVIHSSLLYSPHVILLCGKAPQEAPPTYARGTRKRPYLRKMVRKSSGEGQICPYLSFARAPQAVRYTYTLLSIHVGVYGR